MIATLDLLTELFIWLTCRRVNYYEYIQSARWKRKARRVRARDLFCQKCGARGYLEVHHKTYAHLGYEPLSDLVSLCSECHQDEHNID